MKNLIAMGVGAALLVVGLAAQQRRPQDVDLQRAIRTETVDRDCRTAIKQYDAIVSKYRSDRATVATALIHQAECHRMLGDSQARAIYERVVREFPDRQEEVAVARGRLGVTAVAEKGDRAVWTGPNVDDVRGRVSADGRYLTHTDWSNGSLMLRELSTGLERVLTPGGIDHGSWADWSVISGDGKRVAYAWWVDDRTEFRIAPLEASGLLRPRTLASGYFTSLDWSPDERWISAARNVPGGTTEVVLISVTDGAVRVLKSAPRAAFVTTNRLEVSTRFSPDGKYIAYHRPAPANSQQHDIFIIDLQSGRELPAVVHDADDRVLGWSPAGALLLFTSNRTDSVGLWGLPFADGRAQGPARRLKADIGSVSPLGLTTSGTLYVSKQTSTKDIAIAPLDLDAGKLLGSAVAFTQGFVEGAEQSGSWSPAGQFLAVRCGGGCLAIRSTTNGQIVRRLATTLTQVRWPNWSADGQFMFARGTDRAGHQGIFKIDVGSGEASPVLIDERLSTTLAKPSPDGQKIYFNRRGGVLVERDMASEVERELYRESEEADVRNGDLSPDGRYFAMPRQIGRTGSILIIPVAGGPPREVMHIAPPEKMFLPQWTPDSRALLVMKQAGARWELWIEPIDGRQPRRLDIDPAMWEAAIATEGDLLLRGNSGFTMSQDGRRLAFVTGEATSEVWALENFLPARDR